MSSKQDEKVVVHTTRPLVSLNAIVFDLETTGLDTSKARVIQIGAVRVIHGRLVEDQSFQSLINPGEAIPQANSKIHGIHDRDVANAGPFTEVNNQFNEWRGDSVLIGYANGFDLAMLKREHELAGLEWVAPRTLDIRYLVNVVEPNLPDFSLDTIASWLGVEIHDRHSALGDAVATARIFIELIPLLRERGVRTLAEAERACFQSSEVASAEVRRGWQELNESTLSGNNAIDTFARFDTYPYRHRVNEIMTDSLLWVDSSQNLASALCLMMDNNSSAAYVTPDELHDSPGIVTERDLLRILDNQGESGFSVTVGDIAKYPLESLPVDAFIYRAISRMQRLNFRHLGVHDRSGNIVGALSARDLLRQRADHALLLGDEIDYADSAAAMAEAWGNIALVASGLCQEGVDVRNVAAVISSELCALTSRACKIAEVQMSEEGFGDPPCAYAMLVLGSGGRGESLLAMDQDNAIIYEHGKPDGEQDRWFAELGKKVSDILHIAGVPYCKGGVMASKRKWRQSELLWKRAIDAWIKRQKPEDILDCDIFFDAVCVHGNVELANGVIDYAFEKGSESKSFLKLMSINAMRYRPPLGLFGRFQLIDGRMDLKRGGIMPLFAGARALAIKYRCRELSTSERLSAALARQDCMHTTFQNLREAHRIILRCILHQQLVDLGKGIPLSNKVTPASLEDITRKQLKWALKQVPNVSNVLGDPLT
jgi:DNA polymerase-3 subunit epsilon/CBS domain-containing protein